MKKKLRYLIFPAAALILELLPYGAVCNFANPEGEAWRSTYSYFDLLPFGYANFAPFLTAVTSCVLTVLLAVYAVSGGDRLLKAARWLMCVAVLLSLCPLLLGLRYYSIVGGLISAALLAGLLMLFRAPGRDAEM